MSAFLMFLILAVAADRAVGEAALIATAARSGSRAMFGGPITGASMNPMRSRSALVSGGAARCGSHPAPIAGTAIRRIAYQFVRGEQTVTA